MPSEPTPSIIQRQYRLLQAIMNRGLITIKRSGPSQLQFWFIALLVGIGASVLAIGFRFGIETLQARFYGTDDVANLHTTIANLDWWWIITIPVLGGLAVGVLLNRFTDDGRVRSVADVIEGAALYHATKDGLIPWRERPEHFKRNCVARLQQAGVNSPH